jgi:mono/diheme cytochrome c family protein
MGRRALNLLLLLAFVASLGLHVLAGRDLSQRNIEVLPDMVHSAAYDTLAPNPNFPDGKTLQLPQPGTIARAKDMDRRRDLPLHYAPTPEDALRAGLELHNRFSGDDTAALERGAFLFTKYCQMCHGPAGKGDGSMIQHGIPPSASLVAQNAVEMKDGQLFHVLTYGQRNMSSHAAQLSREDRWKVILHVRALQQRAGALGPTHLILQTLGAQALAPSGVPAGSLAQHLAALGVVESDAFNPGAGVKPP